MYARSIYGQGRPTGPPYINFHGGIGVTKDGPQGIDIVSPAFQFSQTKVWPNASIDFAFKRQIFDLTGSVNSAAFKEFAIGECLFLGASGSKTGSLGNWTITYKFACQANRSNIVIPSFMTIPFVRGWDYLWLYLEEFEDATSKTLTLKPQQYEIDVVYPYADLNLLGV